jgi:hypothetical protein
MNFLATRSSGTHKVFGETMGQVIKQVKETCDASVKKLIQAA